MSIDYSDRNLLFAIMMLRNGFIDETQFVSLLNQWSDGNADSVAELALQQGLVDAEDVRLIEKLVARQIEKHGAVEASVSHHSQSLDLSGYAFDDDAISRLFELARRLEIASPEETQGPSSRTNSQSSPQDSAINLSATSASRGIADTNLPEGTRRSAPSLTALSDLLHSASALSKSELDATSASASSAKNFVLRDEYLKSGKSDIRYAFLRPHAKGGLGKVSVALDTELDREVALKEIRSAYVHDQTSQDRFVLEARITGGLEHPGVVPVYGFGRKPDGSPYFAMRFIRGTTMKEATLGYHSGAEEKDPIEQRLKFRNLLSRFVDTCNAVAYAHNRGVIHRDIKPSNIMLGKFGETLVVDWGLAKKTGRDENHIDDDASLALKGAAISGTLDGSTVGTPTFMSPEQAAGRMDEMGPASDIYSLGATLYFLLTGKTAFTGASASEVIDQVKVNNFRTPRERNSLVPAALSSICARAMETQPRDRYATALLLAADVENWMADEPVSAYAEPLLARAGRWLRHHRTLATSIAVLALTVTVASLAGMLFVNAEKNRTASALEQVSREKEKTDRALADLELAQSETKSALVAETNARRQTRDVLNTITDDLVGQLMARQVELGDDDRAFFDRVLGQIEEFTATTGDSRNAANIRADGYFRVGNLQRRLDDLESAEKAYKRADEIWTELNDTGTDARADLASVNANYGMLLAQKGDHQGAIEKENTAAQLLESLIDDHPIKTEYKVGYARLLANRGNAWSRIDQPAKAEDDLRQSISIFEPMVEHAASADYMRAEDKDRLTRDFTNSLSNLASLYSKQPARLDEAAPLYERVIAQLTGLVSTGARSAELERQLAVERQNYGNVLLNRQRNNEAMEQFRAAIDMQVSLSERYPALTLYRRDLSRSRMSLGIALSELSLDGAEQELIAAEKISSDLVSEFPERVEFQRDLIGILDQLGQFYQEQDAEKAGEMFERGLKLRRALEDLDPDNAGHSDQTTAAEINFANFQRESDNFETAIETYQEVLEYLDSRDDPAEPLLRATLFGLGDSYVKTARYDNALECWNRLVENEQDPAYKIFELQRAICTVRTGSLQDGIAAADAVLAMEDPDGVTFYDAACCYAVAAGTTDDGREKETFAARSMELLNAAGDLNFFDEEMQAHAADDTDLDALRSREDFKDLCREFGIPGE